MSSLKHLTLPRRKHHNKDKHENSMGSQASSISQLNTSLQSPQTNPVSHSLSSGEIHIPFNGCLFFTISNLITLCSFTRTASQWYVFFDCLPHI
jgi:hypothetical protein